MRCAFSPLRNCGVAKMENSYGPPAASSPDKDPVQQRGASFVDGRRDRRSNVKVTPDLYERHRLLVTRSKFILAKGPLQNEDGVIHVTASRLYSLFDQRWRCVPMTSTDMTPTPV